MAGKSAVISVCKSDDGCARTAAAQGYCGVHYTRLRRSGDLGIVTVKRDRPGCSVGGCTGTHEAHGLCNKHYLQTKASPEKNRRNNLRTLYGVTPEQYDAMLAEQGHACAICYQPEGLIRLGRPMSLAVDHDHETGKVRGLLCANCNRALGLLADDPERLISAARYVKDHT